MIKYKIMNFKASLILTILFLAPFLNFYDVFAADPLTDDVYVLELNWGSMNFTYDYGTWSTTQFRYVKDETSEYPSAETENGYEGWYGFDGVSNLISIVNRSRTSESLSASVSWNAENTQGIAFSLYSDKEFKHLISNKENMVIESPNNPPNSLPENDKIIKKELYVSFSGKPKSLSGESIKSSTPLPIGNITVSFKKIIS